ncbi:dihydroneopterin aldolase [Castellaniella sp. GW247-6E4]|uniref:dihydroneopterin aldolase n=1 Tax=Castellaniella sp. GW247-6E4 TaxID=3140380 RepID=UPI0033152E1A
MANAPHTRRILLEGLRVQARIGMLDHERLAPQTILFHAEFDTDARRPVNDHDIGSVLDYRGLREALIDEATRGHIDLLESLVDRCLERILRQFPGVLRAKIRISKPDAFPDCDAVAIEQDRARPATLPR